MSRSLAPPCVKDYRLDPATGLCYGCLRSVAEIARWSGADNVERMRLLEEIAERCGAAARSMRTPQHRVAGPGG